MRVTEQRIARMQAGLHARYDREVERILRGMTDEELLAALESAPPDPEYAATLAKMSEDELRRTYNELSEMAPAAAARLRRLGR